MKTTVLVAALVFTFAASTLLPDGFAPLASAEDSNENVKITSKEVHMYIPPDNEMPWGHVYGNVDNPAEEYPVVIQIYNDDGDAVHFAQTEIREDGTFEHVFRIYGEFPVTGAEKEDSTNLKKVNIFSGHYTVKIFKPVDSEKQQKSVSMPVTDKSSANIV